FTNAQGAVIATRPASIPLHIMLGSGLLLRNHHLHNVAPKAPVALASIVFTATTAMRRSVPASVEPGLNPNQPKARMKVPSATIGTSCPGIAFGLPCESYLPNRGPRINAPARAITPPIECTTPEPAKSTAPWPKPQLTPP